MSIDIDKLLNELNEVKEKHGNIPLRISCVVDHGRGYVGDENCDYYLDIDSKELVLNVSGDESSETGVWE